MSTDVSGAKSEMGFMEKAKNWTCDVVGELYFSVSGVKKQMQLISKIAELADEVFGASSADLKSVLGTGLGVIGIHAFYKDVKGWIKPLNKKRIDNKKMAFIFQKVIGKSGDNSNDSDASNKTERTVPTEKKLSSYLKKVLEESYGDKSEFIDAFKNRLHLEQCSEPVYSEIFNEIERTWDEIYKPAPITETISNICFTVTDGFGVVRLLDKWKIFDLAGIAASIGPVAAGALQYAGPVMGAIASLGMVMITVQSGIELKNAWKEINAADKQQKIGKGANSVKSEVINKVWKASWEFGVTFLDCVATISSVALPIIATITVVSVVGTSLAAIGPYIIPVATVTLILMGITSKTIGLVAIIAKKIDIAPASSTCNDVEMEKVI